MKRFILSLLIAFIYMTPVLAGSNVLVDDSGAAVGTTTNPLVTSITGDITLENGELIDNSTDDTVKIIDDDGSSVYASFSATGVTVAGSNERITGSTNGEYIDFGSDGFIDFYGADGTTDSAIRMDLDGTPTILSNSGTLALGGYGNTNNENLKFNFESEGNVVGISTDTGVSFINSSISFAFVDEIFLYIGSGADTKLSWQTTGNDNLQLGLAVGSATDSGYFSLVEYADVGNANRSPTGTSANPVLRVYSSDATQPDDYVEISHDQTNGVITSQNGTLRLESYRSAIELDSDTGTRGKVTILEDSGNATFNIVGSTTTDEAFLSLEDEGGNQVIITNDDNFNKDHDHALQTDPTLYIHSDTDPDTNNTQWVSITHDKTNPVINSGTGAVKFENSCIILKSPDSSYSNCCVDNSDAFSCTGL